MQHFHGRFWNLPMPLRVLAIGGLAIGGLAIAAGLALLFGLILMWLWNWLMPEIFGLPTIGFWQAWGLVLLSHILFKTFPHHDHGHRHDYCHDNGDEERWKRKFHKKFFEDESDTDAQQNEQKV
jgi:hypothetical protein